MLPLWYRIEHSHDSCHNECKPVGFEHIDLASVSCSASSSVGELESFLSSENLVIQILILICSSDSLFKCCRWHNPRGILLYDRVKSLKELG